MPFNRCIAAALAANKLTKAEHDQYQQVYRDFENDFRAHMPPHEAAAEAGRETFRYIEDEAAEKRRVTFLALSAKADIDTRLESFRDPGNGQANPYKAAEALYDRLAPGRNGLAVEQQHEFWRNQAHSHLEEAFDTWRRNMLGQRREMPREVNIVREIFGQRTGDNAAEMLAAGWKRASEELRQAFNRFGGHIGHLEDWGLPQNHQADKIRKAGFEAWRDFLTPMLDRSRMLDRSTGRPLEGQALSDALEKAYNSILTAGWADREPTSVRGRALANRRDDHRFLHFKDADNWFAYQQKFGEADPINAMLAHVDAMARDVAHLQVMGPNPASMLSYVKAKLTKAAAIANEPERARLAGKNLDALYVAYTRSNAAPVRPGAAQVFSDIANIVQSAQLGSATLTAVPSDVATQRMVRAFNGLPEMKGVATILKQLNPANPKDRLLAVRMGLGAHHYAQVLTGHARYLGDIYGHGWSRWINDRVLSLSGLTGWTSAARSAFGVDFFGHVADQAEKSFAELDKPFAAMLQRYGVGAADWDHLRATPTYDVQGVKFIRPADVMARADLDQSAALTLASKLSDAALTETEFAVPSGSLKLSAQIHGQESPGEIKAIITQSTAMYRSFGGTYLLSHGRRVASLRATPAKMSRYIATILLSTTVAGAIAIQAKEIANGRDPRDVNDWKFWLDAGATGGGMGLLGDLIYAGINGTAGNGQGLGGLAAGPIVGALQDAVNTVFTSQGIGALSKEPGATSKNLGTRTMEFAKRYAPGGNLWYVKTVIERLMWDQLQGMIDPGWQSRASRIERWYQKQFQNRYWWHRGDTLPERAPDLSAAGGQQ